MKKIHVCLCILSVLLLSFALFALFGCSKPTEVLPPPENIEVEKRILTWDSVEHATGYVVYVNGEEYETTECRLDLHELTVAGGVFDIDVIASGDQKNYLDSLGMRITVTLDAPPESGTDELGFAYTYCEDVVGYEVSAGTADLTGTVIIPEYFCDYPVKQLAVEALNPYFDAWWENRSTGDLSGYNPANNIGANTVTTAVVLPAHLERIEQRAFYKVVNLTEIVIPDSVTDIGNNAFDSCRNLTNVVLSKNLTVIPGGCFENAPLYKITLPETLVEIQANAFYCDIILKKHSDSVLPSVTIPASVQVIGASAFEYQKNLETIIFEDSTNLKTVGQDVFARTAWYEAQPNGVVYLDTLLYGCKGLLEDETLHIAAPTTVIAEYAFCDYSLTQRNIKKIIITAPLKEIPRYAFANCDSVSEVILPDGLETIGEFAFGGNVPLKSIDLPDSVTTIGEGAFASCGLETFTLPKGVTTFQNSIVDKCPLTEITIPKTVTEMGYVGFCASLTTVVFEASLESLTVFPFLRCEALTHFYFGGTRADLEELIKDAPEAQKQLFTEEIMYFYSETEPSETGNYWHYVDGVATPWFE